jgi:hypothetical protein
MLIGSIGLIVAIVLLMNARHGVSFTEIALILSLLSASLACGYGPWFASFTETLESHNPALIATGSSLYGFATRLVGVPFGLIIPVIVGSPAETFSAEYRAHQERVMVEIQRLRAADPALEDS